jgi:hypothetical protein
VNETQSFLLLLLQAMSIVSDLISKKQFDKLQGMIDNEVLYFSTVDFY